MAPLAANARPTARLAVICSPNATMPMIARIAVTDTLAITEALASGQPDR